MVEPTDLVFSRPFPAAEVRPGGAKAQAGLREIAGQAGNDGPEGPLPPGDFVAFHTDPVKVGNQFSRDRNLEFA